MDDNQEDASELIFGEDFQTAECLTLSEVRTLLKEKEEQMMQENPENKKEVFDKTLRYVDRLARDLSRDQIKDVRKALGGKSLHHFEVAQLINLDVESAEEAKFLIPSLNRISDEGEIVELLEEMKGVQDL